MSIALTPNEITNFTNILRKYGVRITRQRIALVVVLNKATDHPDRLNCIDIQRKSNRQCRWRLCTEHWLR